MPLQGPAAPPPVGPNNAASNKEPAVTHRAEPPQPPPAPSPLGNAEKLCPCSQKESPAPTRVPRLRAVVESQAFRNILVDEMDMMMSRAATLIQANWRRHQLRQKLVSQVTAARAIQEAWRRFSTRRLRRLSHAPLKKAKAEDENIPYHPPAQVRFQQVEDAEPPGLPAKASKQTQFPSSDVLPPPHPSQGAAPPGDPSITFLPHQTVTIKLVGPGAPEASFQPCLLTRTVHSSGVGSQAVKMDEASIKASKAGAPGPAAVSQRAAIKTQVHSGEGPQKVHPQTHEVAKTAPGMTATKIPPQLYPPTYPPPAGRMLGQPRVVAAVPRPAPQTYPPATVTVTSTPSQMFPPPPSPCASVKSPPLPSGLASFLGRFPMPTCPPPPARTPLQSCLAVLMNRSPAPTGPPEPAAQMTKPSVQMRPTAPVTNAPTQSRAVTSKGSPTVTLLPSSLRPSQGPSPAPAKTPPPTCPTPGMGRARSLLQPPSTVTKASLHTCRTVTISRTPSHAQQAPPLPKTAPQTRLAAMITKTPAHLRSVAAVLRALCTPPTPPVPAGHAKAAPPPPPGVPATASSHLSLTITRMKTTAVNARHVTGLLKVPSQPTLPDGPVRFAPPQPAAGKAKPASPAGGPVEMDKNRALPSKQGKAERTTGPMAQGMPWGARAHPGPGKLQSQVVLQPTPVTPFLQPRAGAHPLTQLNKVLSQRPDSQTLAHSPPSTNLSQAKTPPQGRPPAATTKAPPQTQLPLGSSRVPFMPPQATSKLNSKPQSPPLLTSFKTSPLRPAGHPTSSVDSGDSQVARGSPTPATQSQEELAASQVAALCSELANMLASQEDLRVLLAKGLPQGDTRTALGQALSKEVLATSVGRALPQGMVGLALLRALSWTELGTALSRALSRGELRTELTKTMQGQLADVLSKALTEEERAALGQALCQGELGAVLSQALLRTGLVLPKANLKAASRGMAPRAPVEMDFRGLPGSWGPTLGPGRPQQSKVRGPWLEAWGGCVPAWPVGFLAEMGDGLLMVGSSCSLVVSGVPPFLGRVLLTLEPYFNSPRSLRGSQETICPLLGATDLLFHLTSWAEGLGPEQPAGSPFPLPANLWQPLHANGVGPSTGQPSLPRAPSQASHRTPAMGRGAPQAWETSGVGRGAVDKASRTTRGCGRDMRPKTVTFRGHVCTCQLSGARQTDPSACRCFVSKQHPARGVSGTVQRPRATSAKPGREGCREASGVTPSARQATKYSRVPLSPARPKTGDRCLSLMPSPLTPCHRRVLGSRVEPSPLQVAPPIALPPPPVVAPPPVLTPPTCPIPCALEPLGSPQLELVAQGSPECQAKHLPSDLASASSSAEGLLTRTLFLGSSQSLQPNASPFSLSATSLDNLLVASEAQEGSLNKAEKEAGGPGESPTFCNVSELIPALARTPASSRVTFKLHWRPHNRRSLGEASDPNFLGWDQLSLKRSRSLGSVHMPPVAPQLGPGVGKSCFRDLGTLKGCGLFDRPQSPVATPILLEPITCTNVTQDGGGHFPKIQISQAPKAGSPGRQRCPLSNTAGVAPGPECPPLTCQVLPNPGHLSDEGAPRQSCPPWAREVTPDQSQTSATGEVAPISAQLLGSITAAPNFAETPKSPEPAQVSAPPALAASGQDDPCSQPQDTPEARACRPFVVQITYSHPYPRCTRSRARGLSSPAAACRNPGPHQSPRSDHFSRVRGNSTTTPTPCAPSASAGWEGTRQGAGAGGSPRLCFCGSGVVSDTQGLVAADLFQSVVQRPMSPKGSRSRSPRAPCCALPPRTCVSQATKEKPPSRSQPSFTWGLLSHRLTISPNTYPAAHPAPCFPPLSPESLRQTPPPALHPSGHSPPSTLESGPGGLLLGSLIRSIGQKTPLSRIPCPPCEPQACPEEPGGGWTPGPKAPSLPQSLVIGLSPRPFQGRTGRMGAAAPSQAPSAPGLLPVLATSVLQGAEQLIPGAEGTLETQGSQVLSSSLGSSQPAVCEATPWVHPNPLVGDTQYSTGSLAEDPSPLQDQMPGLQEVDSRQAQLKGTGPAHLPPRSPCVSKRPIQTGSTTPPPQQRPATSWGASAPRSGLRESIKGTGASMAPPSPAAQQMTHTAPVAPQSPSAYRQFPMAPVAPQSSSFHQHEPMAPVVPWSPAFPQQVSMASMEPQGSSFPQQVSVAPVEPQGPAFPQQVSMDPMAPWSPSFHQQVSVAPMEPQGPSFPQQVSVAPVEPQGTSFPQQVSVAPVEPQGTSFPQQVSMDPMAPWSPSFHQQVSVAPEAPQSHEQMSEAPVASLSTPFHQQVSMAPQTPTAHQMTHTAPVIPWSPSAYRQQASMCPVTPKVHRALQQAPVAPVVPKAPPALRQAFVAPMTSKTHSALQQAPVSPGTPSTPQQVPVALVAPKVHPVLQQTPVAPVASKAPSARQQVPVAPVAPKVHPVLQQTPVAPMTCKVHQALKQTPVAPVAPEPPSVLQQVPVAPVAPKVHPPLQQTPVAPMTPKVHPALQQTPVASVAPKVHPALQQTPVAPMAPRVPSERQQVPVTPMTPKVHPTLQQTPVAPVVPDAPSALQKTPVAPKVPSAFQQVPVATMTSKAHRALQQTPVLLVAPEAPSVLQQTPVAPVAPKVPSALQQVPMAAMTPKVYRALQQTSVVPVAPKAPSALQQVPVVPVAPKVHFQQVCVAPVIPKVHSVLQQVPMSPGAPQAHSSLQHAPVAQVEPYNRSHGVVDSSGVLGSQGLTHGSSVAPNLPLGSGAGMATPSVSWGPGAIPRTPRVPPCRSEATVTVAGKCLSSCLKKSCRFSHQEAVAPTVPLVTARSVPSLAARRVHQGFVSSPLGLGCACGPTGAAGKYLTPPVLQGAEDPSVAGGSAWNSAGTSRVAVPPRGAWERGQGVGPWAVGSAAAANPRSSRELASMQVMEKLVIQAVITLQAGVRGYLVRKTIKVWHQWAVVIQAAWRGYCVRRDLARLTRAAVVIQAAWRGFSCRQRRIPYALSPAPWPEAISMSPRMSEHRCFQSCQPNICHLCQSLTSGLGNAPSVVMLVGSSPRTCHMCGQAAPTRVVHGLGQRGRDYSSKKPLSREAAATRIQATWKGFHVRRQLMQQRTAAQRLQATWRGHSTRAALSSNNLLGLNTWKGPRHTQWPGY